MMLHDEPLLSIYFGDAQDGLSKQAYLTWHSSSLLLAQPAMQAVMKRLGIHDLFFLRQIHSIHGYCIDISTMKLLQPFTKEGDYLITQSRAIGLGIMAADCMPIICIDRENQAVGIAHAGWRGAVAGVIASMIRSMEQSWQTKAQRCSVFFGPSAGPCCYQVGPEFEQHLAPFACKEEVLRQKKGSYFFDNALLITYQLEKLGVAKEKIDTTYNICTICDDRFYSHRRSQADYNGRQMTVVALK